MLGDFNIKGIPRATKTYHEWDLTTSPPTFWKLFGITTFSNNVDISTRYREGNTPSIFYLVITNEEGMVNNLKHSAGFGKSVHETYDRIHLV